MTAFSWKSGAFGQQAPVFHGAGTPAWADAGLICPWTMYLVYGDKRILAENYDAMARYIDYCHSHKGLVGQVMGFGNWLAIGSKTPKDLISAAYFAYSTNLMARIAGELGKQDDAEKYTKLFHEIRENFQQRFIQPDGTLPGNSQTSYCLALYFDLLTKDQRAQAAANLVESIKKRTTIWRWDLSVCRFSCRHSHR